jgi:hypothetical protein
MIPNPIQMLTEFVNSVLSPIPGFARGYVVIIGFGAFFWALGSLSEDSADDVFGQVGQGVSLTSSGVSRVVETSAPLVASGTVVGGKALAGITRSVGRGMVSGGSSLVEVEEAPIKIGPLVEIYGLKIGLIGFIAGLLGLGGLVALSNGVPFIS